jgi:hypothetical protein
MSALSIRRDRTPSARRHEPEEAAQAAGMDRRTLRDWVIRYNETAWMGSPTGRVMGQAELDRRVLVQSAAQSCAPSG